MNKITLKSCVLFLLICIYNMPGCMAQATVSFELEASMLGYFAKDGTRNPTLKAQKGQKVQISITNAETMTHDISMERAGVKSKTILEKGSKTSITFVAKNNDTYYCSIPGHRAAGMVGKFEIVNGPELAAKVIGTKPTKNGKKLNLDAEAGTLQDWTASGEAFKVVGQNPSPLHDKELNTAREGKYFISSGGMLQHELTGSLKSASFTVSKPWASFMVSGGALADTRVELILANTDEVIFKSTGQGRATLQPVVADLRRYINQDIYIKLIDNETGVSPIPYISKDRWAHINFDNFQFHTTRPKYSNELLPKDIIVMPPLDPVINAGLSGVEAAKAMTLPEGFKVTLAAAEPEIVRPICFTIDPKGRLWVVEGHTYPVPAPPGQGRDRIIIFEDTNGDGSLDSRKVFMEGLNLVSGIEIGMGGLWLGAAPYLLFVPVDFENDTPKSQPQILLDGWGLEDTHEVLNSFRWGPDGWLYGTHGVFTHSKVGKPGTPDAERTKLNAGVWRYHPTKHLFEVFSEGTSNPWGLDFNDYGQGFITACVIPHMYHVIQGARYERQAGKSFNPYTFDEIKTIADHRHYVGERGPHAGNFRSAVAGGGHAHAGAMLYLGGSWPAQYHNKIFMNNINGARLNVDQLNPKGSGYSASHNKDFIVMNDAWSQWLNFKYDASGSVWAIDWYDKNQCHSPNPDVHDKTMGRIFKISHQNDHPQKVNLWKATDMELVAYQLHTNEWYVRTAKNILQERGPKPEVHAALKQIISNQQDISKQLRALWALQVCGGLTEKDLTQLLRHENEYMRAWAVQFLAENRNENVELLQALATMAIMEPSPIVCMYLCSALQRFSVQSRWQTLEVLLQRNNLTSDPNLPLMLWYTFEPLTDHDAKRALTLAENSKVPNILKYTVQKLLAQNTEGNKILLKGLKNRLSHEQHELMILIDKEIK